MTVTHACVHADHPARATGAAAMPCRLSLRIPDFPTYFFFASSAALPATSKRTITHEGESATEYGISWFYGYSSTTC